MTEPIAAAAYDEDKHTRGQPSNAGQFATQTSQGEHSGSRPGDPARSPAPQVNTGKQKIGTKSKTKPRSTPKAPVQGKGTLARGGRNDPAATKRLQSLINELGLGKLAVDGIYGPATEAAIKGVQARLGMKQTGVSTPALMQRMQIAKALSPCVGGAVKAAAEEEYEDDYGDSPVVDRVEVSPGMWICAHDDGTVSMKMQVDPADWTAALEQMGTAAESKEDDAEPVAAAAGHDVTPGHDELHHWWVYGEGKARWRTWTELRDQLVEHVGPVKAAVYASAWFHERYGYWSGSDINRVKHGKPPRGEKIGPG